MEQLLQEILIDKTNRKKLIQAFQNQVWDGQVQIENEEIRQILNELAYDLSFYEPDKMLRNESMNYYGDEKLETEILAVLQKIRNRSN